MSAATDALAAGLFEVTEAVRNACADPADAVRLLSDLATFAVAPSTSTAPIGSAIAVAQQAAAAVARRASLASLALACADLQPASYDHAVSVRNSVSALIATEAVAAADAGQGATYQALRALGAAVVADLNDRGLLLPRLTTERTGVPMPSLALAYELYGDASRADELTARSGAEASLFLPTRFRALSS